MARIVLNTFGSFGDLHPYLAVAIELRRRGHNPVVATAEVYRTKVQAEGVSFAAIRPNLGDLIGNDEFIKKLWHPRRGSEYLIRDYIMPAVEGSYEDLLPVCANADLLLTHFATFAAPLVAEKLNLKWLSIALQPAVFLSRYDQPVLAPAPWLRHLAFLGPTFMGAILSLGKRRANLWAGPIVRLRRRVGLPQSKAHPLVEGQYSPYGTLAWFSRHFAQPQPDWPAHVQITGFPFYDKRGSGFEQLQQDDTTETMKGLLRFLENGPPPVVFTLGSSAVLEPGVFYQESLAAAKQLGVRAVLLAGSFPRESLGEAIPDSIHIASYAPYSEIMPKCAASVHQGGIGTTAQALRSGRPMIVVPWAHDQPDNAHRIERMGVGKTVSRSRYTAAHAARALNSLLTTASYAEKSRLIGDAISKEHGIAAACDAIEEALASNSSSVTTGALALLANQPACFANNAGRRCERFVDQRFLLIVMHLMGACRRTCRGGSSDIAHVPG